MQQTSPRFQYLARDWPLLTWTSTMSCWSFSLPAGVTCPGARFVKPKSVCGNCYAMAGRYNMPTVMDPQAARLGWLRAQQLIGNFVPFVDRMTIALDDSRYFRWFDSGDLFSAPFARAVREVCKRTRHVLHWIPTHSWLAADKELRAELRYLHRLSNVMVRPSAELFDEPAPQVPGLGPGLAVHTAGAEPQGQLCPKSENHTDCQSEGCRACWTEPVEISFRAHGRGDSLIANTPASRKKRAEKVAKIAKV